MTRSLLLLVVCLLSLTGCNTAHPLRLRVLTYNIHHGEGTDGKIDLQRIADVIKQANPDLVALQEVDVNTRRSGRVDQAAKLAELTGMHHFFGKAIDHDGGEYGNAILARNPIDEHLTLKLSGKDEDRCVAVMRYVPDKTIGYTVTFGSTHLSHVSESERKSQLAQIKTHHMLAFGDLYFPAILAGDFNMTPGSEAYHEATQQWQWVDAAAQLDAPQPTYPAANPKHRIDYILHNPLPELTVISAQILDAPVASDHAPLLVELEFRYVEPYEQR